jgi:hypothetical protein
MHHHCIADFEHSATYWIPCFTIPEGYISTCQDLDSSAILHVITYLSNGRFRGQTVVQAFGTCEIPTFYQQVTVYTRAHLNWKLTRRIFKYYQYFATLCLFTQVTY